MKIGDLIKNYRDEHDMSMDDFARLSGLTKGYISMLEKNKHPRTGNEINPSIQTFEKVAKVFKKDVDELVSMLDGNQKIDLSKETEFMVAENLSEYDSHKIPLLGTIAAGSPILAEQNIEDYIDLGIIKCDFALRIQGDSMIGANIKENDIVFIKQTSDVENGQIAAVLIDECATLKRVFHMEDGLQLQAENPKYPAIVCNNSTCDSVKILGELVAVLNIK